MSTEIAKEFSMLDVLLNSHRKSSEGHIILTPEEAREVLLSVLYAFYEESVNIAPTPGGKTDPKIEALRRVAIGRLDTDPFDFTATLEKIRQERAEQDSVLKKEQKKANKSIFTKGQRTVT